MTVAHVDRTVIEDLLRDDPRLLEDLSRVIEDRKTAVRRVLEQSAQPPAPPQR